MFLIVFHSVSALSWNHGCSFWSQLRIGKFLSSTFLAWLMWKTLWKELKFHEVVDRSVLISEIQKKFKKISFVLPNKRLVWSDLWLWYIFLFLSFFVSKYLKTDPIVLHHNFLCLASCIIKIMHLWSVSVLLEKVNLFLGGEISMKIKNSSVSIATVSTDHLLGTTR